jgi:hypothetical protein
VIDVEPLVGSLQASHTMPPEVIGIWLITGAPGAAGVGTAGVTGVLAAVYAPGPAENTALTLNTYEDPFVRPVTVAAASVDSERVTVVQAEALARRYWMV